MLCVCVAHVVVKAARGARVAEGQAERAVQARVRAARHTDLPLLLAREAELVGAIAAGGDAIYNNNNFSKDCSQEGASAVTAVLASSASGQRCASTHLASCVCALPRWRGHGKKGVKSQRVPSYAGIRNV